MHRRWQTASRDDLLVELERQEREIARQRAELERAERERERAERERERAERERDRFRRDSEWLRKKIKDLEQKLDAVERARFRQAAPFSRGAVSAAPRRPGRKAGAGYGRRAHRPIPSHVDEHFEAPLPAACPACAGALRETHVALQYQEDLPVVRPIIRAFHVHVGRCATCGHRVQGRHPLQTSDALGAAAAQVGPHALALAAILNKQLGLSLGKVTTLLRERFGLSLTCGGLVHALRRTARRATPSYQALLDQVRGSPVVAPDETGWKVAGRLHWLWAFATPDTTVYAIQSGRGFEEAAAVLGADFSGALVRDGWAPYRQFTAAVHQSCLAHLLRRCRTLERDFDDHRFAPSVAALLQQGLGVRDRWHAGTITDHRVAVARGVLQNRMLALLDTPRLPPPAERFARHLDLEFSGLFSFLLGREIDATNWRAEQAIRPAVVNRKVWGGNRTAAGAVTQQVLTSVLRTSHLRRIDASGLLVEMLRSPKPFVPRALAQRPAGPSTR